MRAPRRGLRSAALVAALLLAAVPAAAQSRAVRFEVDSASDSTFVFQLGKERWVRSDAEGIVVDPARRDALVARFRIKALGDGRAVGVVTGQTTDVAPGHVALIEEPRQRWWRRGAFWAGLLLGLAAGGAAGAAAF